MAVPPRHFGSPESRTNIHRIWNPSAKGGRDVGSKARLWQLRSYMCKKTLQNRLDARGVGVRGRFQDGR